jgi:DNA-binding Xre family transcriptional regulator
LPRRIVRFRELRGVNQTELAAAAGISRSTLNVIEGGLAQDMRVSTLERLCLALGVSGDALLGYDTALLIRNPALRGLQQTADGFSAAYICNTCGKNVAARALHLPGDCMVELFNDGASEERIGAVFGLSTSAVRLVLSEEHETRRRRKF